MGHTLLFIFLTLFCTPGLGAVTLVPSENPVADGHNVTISLSEPVSLTAGLWLFNGSSLFMWYPGAVVPGNNHQEGIFFNSTSYQLTLQSVTLNSSGLYSLDVLIPKLKLEIVLEVQEHIKDIRTTVSTTNAVEFNDTVTFTCTAGGTPQWFSWQNNSSPVTAGGRVQLSNGGRVLVISNVTRYDKGPFKCVVANNVSWDESSKINLTINYGPGDLLITTSPEQKVYISGSLISLSCSADSLPSASFFWMYNNNFLNANGPSYKLASATQNQTGQYTCVAQNPVTLRYAAVTTTLHIVDPVSAVAVNPSGHPIEEMPFSLSCHVVGPVNSIQWMKNGEILYANDIISFSSDNSTLSFSQVIISDDGLYACRASNEVSNMTSPDYNLLVNYGPYNTQVFGPVLAAAGSSVKFNCTSDHRPTSHYSWWFGGSKVGNDSVFVSESLSVNHSGEYTCMAFNPITGKNSTASLTLKVIVPVSNVIVSMDNQLPILNQSFTLNCHSNGDVEHFSWMKDGAVILNGSAVLSFAALTLSDDGLYQCEASNAVSKSISQAFDLRVYYGPWNTKISGPFVGAVGDSVIFNCSADSYPESQYSWWFNDSKVAVGPVFGTGFLSLESSGLYTCEAHNNYTNLRSSASHKLTVYDPVSDAIVVGSQHPILGQPFQLNCSASGDVQHIQWMKNSMLLYPGNGITFSSDNSALSFQSLALHDNGNYECEASNAVSKILSQPYDLMVNYGPWNVSVTGPISAETGDRVNFSCSADSYPGSQFSWWFNGSQAGTGPVYETGVLTLNHGGLYTCVAVNGITGHNSSASLVLTVYDAITAVEVISKQLIPLASQPLQLTCKVNGQYLDIHWHLNGSILQSSSRVSISADSTTVTFNPLQTTDNGEYQCVATSSQKEHFSQPYKLQAVYGPENMRIQKVIGISPKLICSAESHPPAEFKWINANNTVVGNQATYVLPYLDILGSNNTCVAKNPLTNVTRYLSHVISYSSAAVNVQASVLLPGLVALLLAVLTQYL